MANGRSRGAGGRTGAGGIRLGRLFGVQFVADWSLLIIFALIVFSLAAGVFPQWHPEWGPVLTWVVAGIASLLFFASIAAHELSHALVGRAFGIPIDRITLFVFGGMAHMSREPDSPRAEFLMAAVGPLTSVLIGFGAILLGGVLGGDALSQGGRDPLTAVSTLSPVATLLLWIGPINLLLGIFNMIPGFPLDGGRVLRSILWWLTGSLQRATRWASWSGQAVAWGLMGIGVLLLLGREVPWIGAGFLQGVWLILIGWFLNNAARASYEQLRIREALAQVAVREVMRPNIQAVQPGLSIDALMREHILTSDESSFPVMDDGNMLGMISVEDVRAVPPEKWRLVSVGEVMTPAGDIHMVRPNDDVIDALRELAESQAIELPVADNGKLVGFVRKQDIMKWLAYRAQMPAHRQ